MPRQYTEILCENNKNGYFVPTIEEAPLVLFCCRDVEDLEALGPGSVLPMGHWEQNNMLLLKEEL